MSKYIIDSFEVNGMTIKTEPINITASEYKVRGGFDEALEEAYKNMVK